MSNWERRPLRLSQQHYGALDAYILIDIVKHLIEKAKENGLAPFHKFCKTLDNRKILVAKDDDSEEFDPEKALQRQEERVIVNRGNQRNKRQNFKQGDGPNQGKAKKAYGNTYGHKG